MKRFLILMISLFILMIVTISEAQVENFRSKSNKSEVLKLDITSSVSIALSNSFELEEIRAREGLYSLAIGEKLRNYFPSLTFSYMQTDEVKKRESDHG
ncbi:MAG: hypothetical protein CVV49_07230 [Spirochaetae bacterium HGW-Spirochaetae-5]|nr:MAG: hypothetical protein CVV49_07230 [Spirochaetae bacterium HGW-Spirochaetae-5]